jgi:alpha-galactosidase
LPDAPLSSQENNLASLVLGGNGLWGDLPGLSIEDLAFWHTHLSDYKRVAQGVTRAYPRQQGFTGSSPEVYEKVDPETSSGIVVFFSVTPGETKYCTQPLDPDQLETVKGADRWSLKEDGRIELVVKLDKDGAKVVFIFGKEQ